MNIRAETIEVGCAVVFKKGKLLIAQRHPEDTLGGYWEFPGGKKEDQETLEDCLIREVHEELGIKILPRRFLCRSEHEYPNRKVILFFYLCDWLEGDPVCHDCHDFRWVSQDEIMGYPFPEGDAEILKELNRRWSYYFNNGEKENQL